MSAIYAPKDYSFLWESKVLTDINNNILSKEQVIDKITERYDNLLAELEQLLIDHDLIDYCIINAELVWQATLCYFVDVVRIKHFHSIERTAREKIYAYEAFWLLRHHPIQIVAPMDIPIEFAGLEGAQERLVYVNEFIIAFWLIQSMISKINDYIKPIIQIDNFSGKAHFSSNFQELTSKMFYHFRYRIYTAETILQSLEAALMAIGVILDIT